MHTFLFQSTHFFAITGSIKIKSFLDCTLPVLPAIFIEEIDKFILIGIG